MLRRRPLMMHNLLLHHHGLLLHHHGLRLGHVRLGHLRNLRLRRGRGRDLHVKLLARPDPRRHRDHERPAGRARDLHVLARGNPRRAGDSHQLRGGLRLRHRLRHRRRLMRHGGRLMRHRRHARLRRHRRHARLLRRCGRRRGCWRRGLVGRLRSGRRHICRRLGARCGGGVAWRCAERPAAPRSGGGGRRISRSRRCDGTARSLDLVPRRPSLGGRRRRLVCEAAAHTHASSAAAKAPLEAGAYSQALRPAAAPHLRRDTGGAVSRCRRGGRARAYS